MIIQPTIYTSETIAAAHGEMFVPSNDEYGCWIDDVEKHLRRMALGFTLNDIRIMLFKVYEEYSLAAGRRGCLIVLITDVIVRLLGSFDDHEFMMPLIMA